MKKRRIRVTEKDIEAGVRSSPFWCPVATAIRRTLRRRHVTVGDSWIEVGDGECSTPDSVSSFIRDFDAGRDVKPFTFTI